MSSEKDVYGQRYKTEMPRKSRGEQFRKYTESLYEKWDVINRLIEDSIDCNIWMGQDFGTVWPSKAHPEGTIERPFDDISIALAASQARMKAIIPNAHNGPAFFRVPLIQKACDDWAKQEEGRRAVKVIGGVILNTPVGGLNPQIVKMLIQFQGKIVYCPTYDGAHYRNVRELQNSNDSPYYYGTKDGGIEVVRNGKVVPEMEEILGLMADNDLILDMTWVSPDDKFVLMDAGKSAGVDEFKVYYLMTSIGAGVPELQMMELTKMGLKWTPAQANILSGSASLDETMDLMEKVGLENLIGGTSNNIWDLPYTVMPVEGYRSYICHLLSHRDKAWSENDIATLVKTNPAKMLGL